MTGAEGRREKRSGERERKREGEGGRGEGTEGGKGRKEEGVGDEKEGEKVKGRREANSNQYVICLQPHT